ncbi:MAG: tRNA (adenosine(37)-N6)-threonylcarbamoyltransferase complex dimerization subunit type 1 TsaB [Desulfobacteraceae bacterium]|nr:tRNA (adenosine(37)-N6)-threonylcarbamoyltransferase complex dimerization subunit type 1 TsaB [Desulfobacteraceae bacterium]MBC2756939.1 tRNA (adenosine(37)-N6)-threonylcarbamoyltransferase complex dimerization subunit type 1 TsaB [Desulfobacteraceae bacterium]
MKILAVDTATKSCSVAVIDEKSVISEYTVNHKDTHSKFLMGMIRDILDICHLTVKDLDGFAVTIGPGSFTGLRIGLSAIKGLALATGKPVVGASSLEVLAYQISGSDKLICPMLDARRNEVYTARYRFKDQKLESEQLPLAVSPDKAIENINEPCIVVGDGSMLYQDLIKSTLGPMAVFANFTQHIIRASTVGQIAIQRFKSNDTDDAGLIEPFYIRKSDAEKNLKAILPG